MTTRNVAAKGGPADPDISRVIAAARTTEKPKPPTAADLKPGDWLAETEFRGAAQALTVYPYRDSGAVDWVFLTYLEVGQASPNAEHLRADDQVELATAEEIEEVKADASRRTIAMRLKTFAELIVARELPVRYDRLHIHENAGDVETLAVIAERLGLKVEEGQDRYRSVEWPPGHQAYDDGLHVTWYGYAEKGPVEVDRVDVLEPDGSEPVPADAQVVSLGAGAARQVSAPPAPVPDGDA